VSKKSIPSSLKKLQPAGRTAFTRIPLSDGIHVARQPSPIATAKEIIKHVQVTHNDCHACKVHVAKSADVEDSEKKILCEWCIVEGNADDNDADSFTSSHQEKCESVRKDNDGHELSLLFNMKDQAKSDKVSLNKLVVSPRVKEELCEDEPSWPWVLLREEQNVVTQRLETKRLRLRRLSMGTLLSPIQTW